MYPKWNFTKANMADAGMQDNETGKVRKIPVHCFLLVLKLVLVIKIVEVFVRKLRVMTPQAAPDAPAVA